MKHKTFIRKLFWPLCMPFFLISTVWCVMKGLNPFENYLFLVSTMSMIPMLMNKAFELQDSLKEHQILEFKEMGATEFLNFMDEFKKIPLGTYRATCKEAYRQEYLRRYHKDIFHVIPMYGS